MDGNLPDLVSAYVRRSLPAGATSPAVVRVTQAGEMWQKPGARRMRFEATEHFAVDRVAFSWRARFPVVGPLALTVVDEFADGDGRLRVSLLGVPLQAQTGPEIAVGEAMRYLAEVVWAPHAIVSNRELTWRELDDTTVEVAAAVGAATAAVRWHFDASGDVASVTATRPFRVGKTFVPRPWAGRFADYESFAGTRVPTFGEVWWELPEGRFVYWRGRVTAVEAITSAG